MKRIKKICEFCHKVYRVHPYRDKTARFCNRVCLAKSKTGNKNPCWRGGRIVRKDGYVFLYTPDHPFAKDGHVLEHRLVMEEAIGRFLKKEEVVHHLNEIKSDNRIENLMLFKNNSEHVRFHTLVRKSQHYEK